MSAVVVKYFIFYFLCYFCSLSEPGLEPLTLGWWGKCLTTVLTLPPILDLNKFGHKFEYNCGSGTRRLNILPIRAYREQHWKGKQILDIYNEIGSDLQCYSFALVWKGVLLLIRAEVIAVIWHQSYESKVAGGKVISETKSKQQSPCRNFMPRPVTSWGNACNACIYKPVRCMHQPVTSQADACTYCKGSKVSSLSWIYLYSSYFGMRD